MKQEIEQEMYTDNCRVKCKGERTGKKDDEKFEVKCRITKGTPQRCGRLNKELYDKTVNELEKD